MVHGELGLLMSTLEKMHISAVLTEDKENIGDTDSHKESEDFLPLPENELKDLEILDKNVYALRDSLGFRYLLLRPSGEYEKRVLIIGPYLTEPLTSAYILELSEKCMIPPKSLKHFTEYLKSIPVINTESPVFLMIYSYCERAWNTHSFGITELNGITQPQASLINETMSSDSIDASLVGMAAMEKRYNFENELISAVRHGQIHKENMVISAFSDEAFERRLPDALRNAKNYGIIMNTLLRKAAEEGGVHPVYIDKVSSDFAAKIENMPSLTENSALMADMFRTYCRLVRKHSMTNYSPPVQKTVLIIDSDISADLSPSAIADTLGISQGYLSSLFKKETGMTIVEYIWRGRISHAAHLLTTTSLQIQTVALHCGITDVQYFSKTFKKHTGKTPKEYREAAMNK